MPACRCSKVDAPAPWRTMIGRGVPDRARASALHSSPVSSSRRYSDFAHRVADRVVVPGREAEEEAAPRPGEAGAPLRDEEPAVAGWRRRWPTAPAARDRRAGGSRSRPPASRPAEARCPEAGRVGSGAPSGAAAGSAGAARPGACPSARAPEARMRSRSTQTGERCAAADGAEEGASSFRSPRSASVSVEDAARATGHRREGAPARWRGA